MQPYVTSFEEVEFRRMSRCWQTKGNANRKDDVLENHFSNVENSDAWRAKERRVSLGVNVENRLSFRRKKRATFIHGKTEGETEDKTEDKTEGTNPGNT